MDLLLVGGLLFGWALAWFVYAIGTALSLALVLPKIRSVRQPLAPWVAACLALPLATYAVVAYKLD